MKVESMPDGARFKPFTAICPRCGMVGTVEGVSEIRVIGALFPFVRVLGLKPDWTTNQFVIDCPVCPEVIRVDPNVLPTIVRENLESRLRP